MLLQHSPQCYLSGPERRLARCNSRILTFSKLPSGCIQTLSHWQFHTYLRTLWYQRAYLTLRDGILYRHWKDVPGGGTQPWLQLLLPPHIVPEVLQGLHSSPTDGHLGISKTLEKVVQGSFGHAKDMMSEIGTTVVRYAAPGNRQYPRSCAPLQLQLAEQPMQRVAMDILGPLPETDRGNKYIGDWGLLH